MKEKVITTNNYLSISKLTGMDFTINPYVGCPHACKYCYALFMKRFTNHGEPWGDFVDVKLCNKPINLKKIKGKKIFISSVTDAYNPYEKRYEITRKILEQLKSSDAIVEITTKSDLILRDLDLLKQFRNLTVAFSINTLDEKFQSDMDRAPAIGHRIEALKILYEAGISTVLFMSPIFPYITNFQAIMENTRDFVGEYWFENLNLRMPYKPIIMQYIKQQYPQFYGEYVKIFHSNDNSYWKNLRSNIEEYCLKNDIAFEGYFHYGSVNGQMD
ncbi:MAG: radical SAM protein [Puniceicoccales bacterium]|nr:radical SAM protein [Puniceicoccales bacterium]